MISNFVFIAFGINIFIAGGLIVFSVLRYRKTAGFAQSILWGVLIAVVSNVIVNLIGSTIFPNNLKDMDKLLATFINASLMTLGVAGAYIVTSNFQFKKGIHPKTPVINAFAFSLIPLINVIMQSVNFILYSSAINAGTAEKFLNESFKLENLQELTTVLTTSSPLLFLEMGITRLMEFGFIIVIFTLLFKALTDNKGVDFKKALPAIALLFVYYFVATFTTFFAASNVLLVLVVRIVLAGGIFAFFYKSLDL